MTLSVLNLLEKTLQEFIGEGAALAARFGFKTRGLTEFELSERKFCVQNLP